MLSQLSIRQAVYSDLPSLEWDGEYVHFRWLYADTFQMVEQGRALIWVAETYQAKVIGQIFVSLHGARPELSDGVNLAYVFGFRVRTAYRNQGIGTEIMRIVEADLIQRGFRQLTLNVGREKHQARRFYEHLGYAVIAADPGRWSYIDDQGQHRDVEEPAWRMLKELQRPLPAKDGQRD